VWSAFRGRLRHSPERIKRHAGAIVQTAVAASVSWLLARVLLGVERPLFAAVACIVSLGISTGRRGRQAVEVVLGVALGIVLMSILGHVLGHGAPQVGIVVAITMLVAAAAGAGDVFVLQAAVSALLASVGSKATPGFLPTRLLEVVLGGCTALVFSQLLFPVDAEARVRAAARALTDGIAAVAARGAEAVVSAEGRALDSVIDEGRTLDHSVDDLARAIADARPAVRGAPRRRRSRDVVARYARALRHLDLAATDLGALVRVLPRAAQGPMAEREVAARLLRAIAATARTLFDTPKPMTKEVDRALALSRRPGSLTAAVIAGTAESLVDDLLRAAGSAIGEGPAEEPEQEQQRWFARVGHR